MGKKKKKKNRSATPIPFWKKPPVLAAAAILILGIVLLIVLLPAKDRAIQIGFIDVPEPIKTAVISLAENLEKAGGSKVSHIDLDSKMEGLEDAIKKLDILFCPTGKLADGLSALMQIPAKEITALMPTAMRKAGNDGKRQFGLPLVLDHFELAWNKKLLQRTGIEKPLSFDALLEAGSELKSRSIWPLILAGSDDSTLLGFVSAMLEAQHGVGAVASLSVLASENQAGGGNLRALLNHPELKDTLATIIQWRVEGVLHPEWFRMSEADVKAFMENDYTIFVAMYLSQHRNVEYKTIEKFDSIYFPSVDGRSDRAFIAPTVLSLLPDKKRPNKDAIAFAESLIKKYSQEQLSDKTGLAPTNAQCEASDRQASDVRLWVASSREPLPSIETGLYADAELALELAGIIRAYIESGGR